MTEQTGNQVLQSDHFQQALEQHQSGNIEQAMQHYQTLLSEHPDEPQILYLLGTAYCQRNLSQQAIETLQRAIQLNPHNPFAHNNLGNAYKDQQQKQAALDSYNQAIKLKSDYESAFFNRANLLREMEQKEQAIASFQQALNIQPNYLEAMREYGNTLREMGREEEALECYARALCLDKQNTDVHFQRAITLKKMGRVQQAIEAYQLTVRFNPSNSNAWFNLGNLYLALNQPQKAAHSYSQAIQVRADYADAYLNRGNANKLLGHLPASHDDYTKAIQLKPDYTEAYSNRGNLYKDNGDVDQALADYEQALQFQPEFAEVQWNKALLLIVKGDYLNGWALYEWRLRMASYQINCMRFDKPEWRDLTQIAQQTVLVYPEQGYGDAIQFCRYLPLLRPYCKQLMVIMHSSLVPLISNMPCDMKIIAKGDTVPDMDSYCPLMSLPYVFKTSLDTIPAQVPYLAADPKRVEFWRNAIPAAPQLNIGLAWTGSAKHENDAQRSLAFASLSSLLQTKANITWHSLHKEYRLSDQLSLNQHPQLQHHATALQDFADTAALIECLDLVISVDTSVAHLAGALAKPVWILIPYAPDYRWGLDAEHTPWYPTARLFRQQAYGRWDDTLQALQLALDEWLLTAQQPNNTPPKAKKPSSPSTTSQHKK